MKKMLMVIFPILFLGFLFGCTGMAKSPPANIPLKTLLPDLDGYSFELAIDLNKETLVKMHQNVAKQFGIPIPMKSIEEEKSYPIERVIGRYEKGDKSIVIGIDKFINEKFAKKELNRRVESAKESRSMFQRTNSSTEFKVKQTTVRSYNAYYQVFGGGPYGQKYETKLFWINGPYFFSVSSHREGPWPETEAIMIAEKIKQ